MEKLKATPYGSWQFEYTSTGYQYNESTTHTHVGKCQFISRAMSIRQQKPWPVQLRQTAGARTNFITPLNKVVCAVSLKLRRIFFVDFFDNETLSLKSIKYFYSFFFLFLHWIIENSFDYKTFSKSMIFSFKLKKFASLKIALKYK